MENETFIRKYLHAELTDEERKEFLIRLKSDSDFAEEVKIHGILFKNRHYEFADYIATSADEKTATKKSQHIVLFKILRNVAAIFIMASIAYFSYITITKQSQNRNPIEIAMSEPYISPKNLRGIENKEDYWTKAIVHYGAKEFGKAEEEILKIVNPDIEQQFYLGLSKLYQNPSKVEESILIFESILDDPDNVDQEATIWLLSLAYLKHDQSNQAKILLEKIVEEDLYKKDEAIDILSQIND